MNSFLNPHNSVPLRGATDVTAHSTILFENDENGVIDIQNVGLDAIYNYNLMWDTTYTTKQVFDNSGTLKFSNLEHKGLHNHAYRHIDMDIFNSGRIEANDVEEEAILNKTQTDWRFLHSQLSFENSGEIEINNNQKRAIYNLNESGMMDFTSSGNIKINTNAQEGIYNLNIRTADRFDSTTFVFQNSGIIDIQNTENEGFKSVNYAGAFDIQNDGVIHLQKIQGDALETVNYSDSLFFTNNGLIYLHDNDSEGLYNSNNSLNKLQFTNTICGTIDVDGRIKNYGSSSFLNQGLLVSHYDDLHINKHEFVNDGIVESDGPFQVQLNNWTNNSESLEHIALGENTFRENDILTPITNNIEDFYLLENWYTDAQGNELATGTYNAVSNTYTPLEALEVGQHIFYIEATDAVTGCLRLRPLSIDILKRDTVGIQLKMMAEGSYNTSDNQMNTHLANKNLLPLAQPFSDAPWNYTGTETLANIPANAVDWVLLEVRNANEKTEVIEKRAAILLSNGTIVDVADNESVKCYDLTAGDEYYVSVRMRNHLAIMSKQTMALPNETTLNCSLPFNVDDGYNLLISMGNGIYAVPAGDIDGNGVIDDNDIPFYLLDAASINQYLSSDNNLDGNVTVKDLNLILKNKDASAVIELRE